MEERSDSELYELAVSGDRVAVRTIAARYHADLLRHANAKTNQASAAEDAVADAWIRFFNHLKMAAVDPSRRLHKPESLRFWLLTATRNSLMDVFRTARRDEDLAERVKHEQSATGQFEYQPDYLERLTNDERRRVVLRAFRQLSAVCRELLSLLMLDPPMEYADIAVTMDRPIGSIGPTRQRCIDRMRSLVTT